MSAGVILLIERRQTDTASLEPALSRAGYHVDVYPTGRAALARPVSPAPVVIIYDARHMRTAGGRTCQRLRARWNTCALLHCRAADVPLEEAVAADVYLQMPFTFRKVLNRVRLLLPPPASAEPALRRGPYALYIEKRLVHIDGRGEFPLTPKMVDLLALFLRHPNELVSRGQLMQKVWETDYVGDTRTLDVHIRWLREVIEENPAKPIYLRTMRGRGYIFQLPAATQAAPAENKNAT